MRRSSVALGPIAIALILSACVGDRDTASRLNAPGGALAAGKPTAACDFSAMTKAARDYVGSQNAIVKTLIPAMQAAYTGDHPTTAATPAALDILAKIATDRLTTAQVGTNAQGATLVNAVISASCSDVQAGVSDDTKSEFNAEKALAGGVFEVRGVSGSDERPALAFVPKTGGGRQEADPRWGVIPAAGCSSSSHLCTWPLLSDEAGAQTRYLISAYPSTATTDDLAGETAAITTALGSDNAIVVSEMPDIGDKSVFKVGICISAFFYDTDGKPIGANLGLHNGSLLGPTTSTVCGFPAQTLLETSTSWYASLTNRAASWLMPSLLVAQDRSSDGDWVGPTGWSPITFAKVTGTGTSLKFVNTPKTGTVGLNFELQVLATSASNNPIEGVTVTVSLANNSGVPAGAEIIGGPTVSALTDEDGIAHLHLAVNKAGGYTFFTTGTLAGGAATNTTVSTTVLNIKNAKR